jgi:hypothetical protein
MAAQVQWHFSGDYFENCNCTVVCPGVVLTITYDEVEELYFQNPTYGFYFQRLATEHLLRNMTRLETRVAQRELATG